MVDGSWNSGALLGVTAADRKIRKFRVVHVSFIGQAPAGCSQPTTLISNIIRSIQALDPLPASSFECRS